MKKKQAPVLSFVGYANSGKTTLLVRLIAQLAKLGWRVGTLKHDVHGFSMDQPGKDTWRHREAGASVSAILSGNQWAFVERQAQPLDVSRVVAQLRQCASIDMLFLEGFKTEDYPKVVLLKRPEDAVLLSEIRVPVAVVSGYDYRHDHLPVFARDDIAGLTTFILEHLHLKADV